MLKATFITQDIYNSSTYFNTPKPTTVTPIIVHKQTRYVTKLTIPELINIVMSIVFCKFIDLLNKQDANSLL